MRDATGQSVEQRLERLEGANRRWKAGVVLAAGALGVALILGAANPNDPKIAEELHAKRVVVVDEHNTPRATSERARVGLQRG